MCARRFLIAVFILTLLVVAAGFAIFQWGGNVLLASATPQGHFAPARAGDAPDYTQLDSWLARPGIADNLAGWRPDNAAISAVDKRHSARTSSPRASNCSTMWRPRNPAAPVTKAFKFVSPLACGRPIGPVVRG